MKRLRIHQLFNAVGGADPEVVLAFRTDKKISPEITRVQKLPTLKALCPERAIFFCGKRLLDFEIVATFLPAGKPFF